MTTDPVERMFRVLVRALRTSRPALLSSPFSVGDIHQQILPYRHFRRELGLETNQEYELTLMRLLSGEGGYLDVDERLRDGLVAELASSSPEPSRVRDYADAQVSIRPSMLGALGEDPGRAPDAPPPKPSEARCRYCSGAIPQGRTVHFCPHCGQNLQVRNCPACGAELETDWKFCVACGKGAH
jgi:hypothetical protein